MQNLFNFIRKYSYVFIFILLQTLSIVLIYKTTYYQGSIILSWGNTIAGGWYDKTKSVKQYFNLVETNKHLAEENARLRQQIASSYIQYNKKFN